MNLKEMRLQLGLSRNGLAKKLGVSIGSIYNWETGKYTPSIQVLKKMQGWLGEAPAKTSIVPAVPNTKFARVLGKRILVGKVEDFVIGIDEETRKSFVLEKIGQ